eukprot:EG_transcript_253
MWVVNDEMKMELKELSYVPGLYKIFDEILVNAADNKQRDPSMNLIKVSIDPTQNLISVWNNGKGVPVQIHQEHSIHVPELIFGHLLTSSNYDDNEKKTTGGRNGFGAKLTNIFSTEFTVTTYDSGSGKLFKKTWTDSMRSSSKAAIEVKKGTDFTQVTFKPDLSKFGMTHLEDDIVALMKKRVWDIAGCTDKAVKVHLNGVQLPVSDFKDYVNLYPIGEALRNQQFEVNGRWTVCATTSPSGYRQCSFVNSIWTYKGGKHVEYVTKQVVDEITEKLKKKVKNTEVKPHVIKQHLWIFINCLIENPAFDSQTKENLTTVKAKFGSECKLSDKFLDAVCKGDLMLRIIDSHNSKTENMLNRSVKVKRSNRVTGIAKLDEANEAGGPRSNLCTLVLTEGDSAKTLAISGFSIVGRDYWGVFPLRGKLLNVRDAAGSIILKNAEIQNIMKILGLQVGEKYNDTKKLRYGHVMIMADQDLDGSHIKGLLVNFIHCFWPELLSACPGFLVQFITPIVKVTKGDTVKAFYSLPEYREWQTSCTDSKSYKAKYYKGLGTSKPEEAKQYFSDLHRHRIEFEYRGEEDKDAILLAFDKNRIEDRKAWVTANREENPDFTQKKVTISDFINKELVLFSRADCERSIPCLMDGFKPSQRKILFCCFKKKGLTKNEIKVSQLSGYVSEHSAYHHGEASLQGAIIGMAQDFCGSNNLNLLEPNGQFGTRLSGGKDASQARYLFTKLSPLARAVFPADDDLLLTYREDDGLSIEPMWYIPIIPMVLANGCKGIGTGYATSIPNHNPETLIEWIRCKLAGRDLPPLQPWYRDFTNNHKIIPNPQTEGKSYRCPGTFQEVGTLGTVVNITELPVEKWTEDYKNFLEELMKAEIIHEFQQHHTDVTVDFEVQMAPETLREWRAIGLEEKFKLRSSIPVSNLVCFDRHGHIAKFDTVDQIFEEFFDVRLDFYNKRKKLLIERMTAECEKLKNMVRFITEVVEGQLIIMKKEQKVVLNELKQRGYKGFPPEQSKLVAKGAKDYEEMERDGEEEEEGIAVGTSGPAADYQYLLGMKLWSLTRERIEQLRKKLADKEAEFNVLLHTKVEDMWLKDLAHLEEVIKAVEQKRRKALMAHVKKEDPKGKGKGSKSATRLEFSNVVPKLSESAKKLSEEHAAKLAQQEASSKRKEERDKKRLLKGEGEDPAPKRRKKEKPADDVESPVETTSTAGQLTMDSFFSSTAATVAKPPQMPPPSSATVKPVAKFFTRPKPAAQSKPSLPEEQNSSDGSPTSLGAPSFRPPPPPPPKPAARKPAAPRKPRKEEESDDELFAEDSGNDGPDDGSASRPQRAKRAVKAPVYTEVEDSFINDDSEDSSDDSEDSSKEKQKSRKKPASKKLKKNADDDDDDGDVSFI